MSNVFLSCFDRHSFSFENERAVYLCWTGRSLCHVFDLVKCGEQVFRSTQFQEDFLFL